MVANQQQACLKGSPELLVHEEVSIEESGVDCSGKILATELSEGGNAPLDNGNLKKLPNSHFSAASGCASYTCDKCARTFKNPASFQKHKCLPFTTQAKPVSCKKCYSTFKSRRDFLVHKCEEIISCSECGKLYTKRYKLAAHVKIVHRKTRRYACDQCNFKAYDQSTVKKHVQKVHERLRFECEICHKQVTNLKVHYRSHTGERPYKCTLCPASFRIKEYLMDHKSVHVTTRDFLCDQCGKTYKSQRRVRSHILGIHGEKRFSCDICDKKFRRAELLKVHLLVHTKEKRHRCHLCEKTFTRDWGLKLHLRIHNNENPHECFVCGKKFYNPSNLKTHLRSHSKQEGSSEKERDFISDPRSNQSNM